MKKHALLSAAPGSGWHVPGRMAYSFAGTLCLAGLVFLGGCNKGPAPALPPRPPIARKPLLLPRLLLLPPPLLPPLPLPAPAAGTAMTAAAPPPAAAMTATAPAPPPPLSSPAVLPWWSAWVRR